MRSPSWRRRDRLPTAPPQTNGFVERYHRSYTEECLRVERPRTVEEVRTVTAAYRAHYNFERPNQALSCGNRPPRVAFPALPARPSVPLLVDPGAWLETIDGRGYVRRVQVVQCDWASMGAPAGCWHRAG